jgi:predicted acetyltransferase
MKEVIKKLLREILMTDKGNNLVRNNSTHNENAFYFNILDTNNNKIGSIELIDLTEIDYWKEQGVNGYIVTNSSVSVRNQGLGRDAYKALFKKLDKPIFSDIVRSDDANKMWNSFVADGLGIYNPKLDRYHSL